MRKRPIVSCRQPEGSLHIWLLGVSSLFLLAPAAPARATNVVASASRISATAAGHSYAPAIAAEGSRVAFLSHAANLVTNTDLGPHLNLFARDLFSPGYTTLVSVSTNGHSGANASVTRFSLSSFGAVAFETAASNLTPHDTNGATDVFVQRPGAPWNPATLVSVNFAGTGPGNGRSFNPVVSRYSELVVFESEASDLVPDDTNGVADVFVRHLNTSQTRLVSVNTTGNGPGNGPSFSPFMSEYGQFVAFVSRATDLVPGVTNTLGEVYLRDVIGNTTRWAMAGLTSNSPPCLRSACTGWPDGYAPSDPITFDGGNTVIFKLSGHAVVRWTFSPFANGTNDQVHRLAANRGEMLAPGPLLGDFNGALVGYVVGRTNSAGAFLNSWLRRIDFRTPAPGSPNEPPGGWAAQNVISGPQPDGNVFGAMMSPDGARFVFASDSTNLGVPTGGATQIYQHITGAPFSLLLSTNSRGAPGPDLNGVVPATTRWGTRIVWETPDPTVVADDLNGAYDVVIRDLDQGRTTLISSRHVDRPAATSLGSSRLGPGGLSGHGDVAAFTALDGTFVQNDTNGLKDALAFNFATGARTRLTVSATNAEPYPAALNADGRFAVFEQGTLPQNQSPVTNSFRADLLSNRVVSVARTVFGTDVPSGSPSMTPDGRFVAFHTTESVLNFGLSGPGEGNAGLDVLVRDFAPPAAPGPLANYVLASVNRSRAASGNNESRAPAISPDGRWVAFHSRATDLTSDLFPGAPYQIFAYDRTQGGVKLLSYTPSAFNSNATALPVVATNPVFSADSRFVFFTVNSNVAGRLTNHAILRHDLLNDPYITSVTNWTNGPFVFGRTNLARLTNLLVCTGCALPSPSADGQLVACEIAGVDGTTNVVVQDLRTGASEFISLYGNVAGDAHRPLMSLDGRYVVFTTGATGPFNDRNNASDVFAQDRRTRTTHVLSRALRTAGPLTGPPLDTGNGRSTDPVMSYDGRTVAFNSFASNLVPGDYNDARDVFVVSLGSGDTDRDRIDDDWEIAYFNTLAVNPTDDADGDGANALAEFLAGTDPTDGNSIFQVLVLTVALSRNTPAPVLTTTVLWSATPGKTYRVQSKSSLDAPWTDVPGDVLAFSPSAAKTFTTTIPPSQGFYRAVVVP